jgi:hypothetical protein
MESFAKDKQLRRVPTNADMRALGVLEELVLDDPFEAAALLQNFKDAVETSDFLMHSDISIGSIEDLIAELRVLAMSLDDENAAQAWEEAKVTFRSSRNE